MSFSRRLAAGNQRHWNAKSNYKSDFLQCPWLCLLGRVSCHMKVSPSWARARSVWDLLAASILKSAYSKHFTFAKILKFLDVSALPSHTRINQGGGWVCLSMVSGCWLKKLLCEFFSENKCHIHCIWLVLNTLGPILARISSNICTTCKRALTALNLDLLLQTAALLYVMPWKSVMVLLFTVSQSLFAFP